MRGSIWCLVATKITSWPWQVRCLIYGGKHIRNYNRILFLIIGNESLYIAIIIILLVIVIYALWRNGQAVSRSTHERAIKEQQQLQIEYGKLQERERLINVERERLQKELTAEVNNRQAIERTLEGTNAYLQAQQDK